MGTSIRHLLRYGDLEAETPPESHANLAQDFTSHPSTDDVGLSQDADSNSRKRSNPSTRLTYPRKRAIRACQKCRARRTKCDNIRPACTACIDLGAECVYSEGDPSTYESSFYGATELTVHSFDTASLAILEKLNTIEELLRKPTTPTFPNTPSKPDHHVVQTPASVPSVVSATAPEKPLASVGRRMSVETILSWPAFTAQAPILDLKTLLASARQGLNRSSSLNDFFPEQGSEAELLQRFLDHVFIFNPVLEEADLQQYVREVQFNGLKGDGKSCLLLLIYAHGCLSFSESIPRPSESADFRHTPHYQKAEAFFNAAQKRMGLLLCGSTLLDAQCFFLAGVYLMSTFRPLEAWKMFVQALSCCQTFTPSIQSPGEVREREQRLQESVYWTCFKSELELRLELNVFENSIWDLTYPTFYPSPPAGLKGQREVVWYYYLAEIALRRLGNRILNFFHKNPSASTDVEAVAGFEQQAADWIRSLPNVLNFERVGPQPGGDLVDSLKFILDGHLLDCYEMMYWPFVTECVLLGSTIVNGRSLEHLAHRALVICVERINKNEHGFWNRHHGTWLMLRSCTRSALILLSAAKDQNLLHLLPAEWEHAVWKVVRLLGFWQRECKDVGDRLRVIENMMHDLHTRFQAGS